jgi:glutamate synthase (NADPH/NADH) large chain
MQALLAVGAVHQHLTNVGLRCDANIIIETGSARDPHQIGALIGYGATAVYPYLSYHVLNDLVETGELLTDIDDA